MKRKQRWREWMVLASIALISVAAAFFLDEPVREWMSAHPSDGVNRFMRNVSRFGDWWSHAGLGLLLLALAWWRGNKRWMRIFLSMLIALALAGVAARVVKIGVGRARPSTQTEVAWHGPSLSSKYHAFPSGHVAASIGFFAALLLANWRIGLACLPIPILIGFSRLYLGAHYLSDVIFAAFLGLVCALIVAQRCLPLENPQSEI